MEVRKLNHSVYRLQYHVVWVVKYRLKLLNPGLQNHLGKLLRQETKAMPGVEIQELNVQKDHIHMMMVIPPKYAISDVVGRLKQKSSSVFRNRYRLFKNVYGENEVTWSTGYFVSTVGIDEHVIRNDIKYQEKLDSGQALLDLKGTPGKARGATMNRDPREKRSGMTGWDSLLCSE